MNDAWRADVPRPALTDDCQPAVPCVYGTPNTDCQCHDCSVADWLHSSAITQPWHAFIQLSVTRRAAIADRRSELPITHARTVVHVTAWRPAIEWDVGTGLRVP